MNEMKWLCFFQRRHKWHKPRTMIEHLTARKYIHVTMMTWWPVYDMWTKLEWSDTLGLQFRPCPEGYVEKYIVQCYHGHMDCLEMTSRQAKRRQIYWLDYSTCVTFLKHAFNLPWWVFNCDTAFSALMRRGAKRKFVRIDDKEYLDG